MLGAYEIDCDGDGSAETLVKLRNPWSELEWKGRFSDDDKWWDKVNASIK